MNSPPPPDTHTRTHSARDCSVPTRMALCGGRSWERPGGRTPQRKNLMTALCFEMDGPSHCDWGRASSFIGQTEAGNVFISAELYLRTLRPSLT
jgi:hypothetical protein